MDRGGCTDDQQLAELGPGALLEVSNVIGRGCAAPITQKGRVGMRRVRRTPSTAAELPARLAAHGVPACTSCFSCAS